MRQYAILFIVAVLTRVLVACTAMVAFDIPLSSYTIKGDGESYLRYALVIRGKPTPFTNYDTRVFPGYPLLIAAADLVRVPPPIAGLAIDFLSVGIAAVATAVLFGNLRVGWAMVFLIPHYVINSSLAMSEAPLLAFSLTGLALAVRGNRPIAGGLLMGFAGLIRPMAAFAAVGLIIWSWRRGTFKSGLLFGTAAAVVVVGGVVGLHLAFGDALHGVRAYADEPGAYNGSIFTWPFGSLIQTPFHAPSARGRIPYIAVHVLITLGACVLVWRRDRDLRWFAGPWLAANTLFVLCIGSHWGFNHFPRFTIPAQATMFYAYERWLPKQKWVWALIAVATLAMGVWGVKNSP